MSGSVPSSYWQQTALPIMLSTDVPKSAEIVIIGGGILGIATSYWLARSGLAPLLLERTAVAYGATGRNGGVVATGLAESYPEGIARLGAPAAKQILQLTLENIQLVEQVIAEEQIACEYRQPGHIALALDQQQFAAEAQSSTLLASEGVQMQLLDRRGLEEYIATPLSEEIVGGAYTPRSGLIHSAKMLQGLAHASQRRGTRLCHATVTNLTTTSQGVKVHTTLGTIEAKAALVAINAWTGELIPVLQEHIRPVRGQALAYTPIIPPVFTTGMSAAITATHEYWQQTPDGTILIGGCRAIAPGQDVNIRESIPSPEVQGALEHVLPRLFPSLQNKTIAYRWAGLMAFTADYLPIIDQLPGLPGVWAGGGFSGHGMAYSMRLGQLLAQSLSEGRKAPSLEPFRLNRPTLIQ